MSFTRLIVAALVLTAPAALADSIQYTLNATAVMKINSEQGDNNFSGQYVNSPEAPYLLDYPSACCVASISLQNASVIVPAGSVIDSAFVSITVPTGPFYGSGYVFADGGQFGEDDPSLPSVAPTFSTTGTSEVSLDGFSVTTLAMVEGEEVSSQFQDLSLDYYGRIESAFLNPGSNWGGYIDGVGQVDVPYTVSLDVTYSPVPEPSTLALFGTGILGLAGMARRKFVA